MPETPRAGAAPGYLAMPSPPPEAGAPGVVVVHDLFGMTPDLRRQADKLAAGGYIALAPDLWHGKAWPRCVRSALRQVMAGQGPVFEEIDAAAGWLARQDACTGRIGVIGFCLGGGFALLCAPRPVFSVAAVNYGSPVPEGVERMLGGACPVVASYPERDRATRTDLPRLRKAASDLGLPVDITVYPGTTHGFMNQFDGGYRVLTRIIGLRYDPEAAAAAWRRIFAFFGDHIGGAPEQPGQEPSSS